MEREGEEIPPLVEWPLPNTLSLEEERILVAQIQAGDIQAFEELATHYWPFAAHMVKGWVYHWGGTNLPDAEDVMEDALQDSLIALWENLQRPDFHTESSPRAYLNRIIYWHTRNCVRFERIAHFYQTKWPAIFEQWQQNEDIEQIILDREKQAAVWHMVNQLAEPQRVILVLHYGAGFPISACAKELSVSLPTAKIRLHYARQALRPLLAKMLETSAAKPSSRVPLSPEAIRDICTSTEGRVALSQRYGVTPGHINNLRNAWRKKKGKANGEALAS